MRAFRSVVRDERGSVTVLVAVLLTLVAALCVSLSNLGAAAGDRARAQSAADAAALAGVAEGREAAERLAARNGAVLVDYREDEATVDVRVEVHGANAQASARRHDPPPPTIEVVETTIVETVVTIVSLSPADR
jgi:Flp pilus assembly protein TadG